MTSLSGENFAFTLKWVREMISFSTAKMLFPSILRYVACSCYKND